MRPRVRISCLLLACTVAWPQEKSKEELLLEHFNPAKTLTEKQRAAVLKRIFLDREAFRSSREYQTNPTTLGLYFKDADYRRLKGNPIVGYYAADPGFRWEDAEVTIHRIPSLGPHTRVVTQRAWDAASAIVARKLNLNLVPNAKVHVYGASVYVHPKPTQDVRAAQIVVEFRITSPNGTILLRRVGNSPTLGDAIGSSLEFAITYARRFAAASSPLSPHPPPPPK